MTSAAWDQAADAQFVSLGTFRRDGSRVDTPVWVARVGDELVVVTAGSTAKVKRLRREPAAELRVCGRLGRVDPGTPTVLATGRVGDPVAREREAVGALRSKYGVQLTLVLALERLLGAVRRREPGAGRLVLHLVERE